MRREADSGGGCTHGASARGGVAAWWGDARAPLRWQAMVAAALSDFGASTRGWFGRGDEDMQGRSPAAGPLSGTPFERWHRIRLPVFACEVWQGRQRRRENVVQADLGAKPRACLGFGHIRRPRPENPRTALPNRRHSRHSARKWRVFGRCDANDPCRSARSSLGAQARYVFSTQARKTDHHAALGISSGVGHRDPNTHFQQRTGATSGRPDRHGRDARNERDGDRVRPDRRCP